MTLLVATAYFSSFHSDAASRIPCFVGRYVALLVMLVACLMPCFLEIPPTFSAALPSLTACFHEGLLPHVRC